MALVAGSYCSDVRQDCNRWLDDENLRSRAAPSISRPLALRGKRSACPFASTGSEYTPTGAKLPQNGIFDIASTTARSLGQRICTRQRWTFVRYGEDCFLTRTLRAQAPSAIQDLTHLFEKNPHMQVLLDLREPATAPRVQSPFVF